MVGVFTNDGAQLVPLARPMKVEVTRAAKLFEHPIETGASVVDHRVIVPIEIELPLILTGPDGRETYGRIIEVSKQNETVVVQTRAETFRSMAVESVTHEETPEAIDAFAVVVKFREVIFVDTQFQALPPAAVSKPASASAARRGQQSGKPETASGAGGAGAERKSSTAYRLFYGGGGP